MATKISVESLRSLIASERRVVAVTGAGVSTLSGIPDFTTVDSNWDAPVPREVAISKMFFDRFPEAFWHYYKQLFAVKTLSSVEPSDAHLFLQELETVAKVDIFTQNVDGLHSLAGSSNVVEVHGNARWLECVSCELRCEAKDYFDAVVPLCDACGNRLKPTVVLFGEHSEGYQLLENAFKETGGVALFMGTSLRVAPISSFPYYLAAYQPQWHRVYWNDVINEKVVKYFHRVIQSDFNLLGEG